MSIVAVNALVPSNINSSGSDSVSFSGVGTLNIAGTPQSPITVTLSQVGGVGLLDTINISYADVTLDGVAGVSALVAYNIGAGGTLRVQSSIGVTLGTTINFSAPNSHLVIGSGININLLGAITGFSEGSDIDLSSAGFASYSYTDNAGAGTGGTLTLRDAGGNTTGTVKLSTGEYTASSFHVHPDGASGTLIDFLPYVSGISAAPSTGDLTTGANVVLRLTTSAPVIVAGGAPSLSLNDGGIATYDAAHSTSTSLAFNYTVQSGQNTGDLAIAGINLNGATVKDGAGYTADLTGAIGNPAGILQIDTTPPTITGLTTTPGSGVLAAGQVVTINFTPSEAVMVTGGTPTLALAGGGTAMFDAASSTAMNLVFKYTVQTGQNTADLTVNGINLNGAVITDAAGNAANLTGAVGNPAGILQIDTAPPTITAVSTSPGSGAFGAGQLVAINLTPSEAVTVSGGTPTLTLNDGGTATYDAARSSATNLVFDYTVQAGQNTGDLTVTSVNLNGATVADAAGNAANLSGAVGNPAGVLRIDTTPPTVIGVTTNPGSGSLGAGRVVAFSLSPSEAVTVAGGTPTLTLNDGGFAIYDAASSTATNLVFKYTVQSGQNVSGLAVTGSNLNGASIIDAAGNVANLAGAAVNPTGLLTIDTTPPTITSVATTPGSGSFGAGQVVAFSLTSSEAVTVAGGTPTLALNDGGTATYDAASSSATTLVFTYTVQPGQNTADLAISSANLNGATVTDAAGNAASLAGAVSNPAGILTIDTVAPTITGVSTAPGSGSLTAGQVVAISLTPSEAVTVAGGAPTLTLNDGGIATYDSANSTATHLVFDYTVQSGQNVADLAVTGSNLNGATITDAAGNAANLAGAAVNPAGILAIDTTPPTIVTVSTTPGSGAVAAGQVVSFNVSASEAVTVSGGTPTLTLNDGRIATYDPASSTPTTLVFKYVVQPGDMAADLAVTGANSNGALITDAAGNVASLAGAIGNPTGILQVDTTMPAVTSVYDVTTTPGSGNLSAGSIVALQVQLTGNATVSGGTPTLTLNDAGTAIYDSVHSTPTTLVFNYTVQAGDNTADLAITAVSLHGATIVDGSGHAIDLTPAAINPGGILRIDTVAPTVIGVSTSPGSGTLGAGQVVAFNVVTSEAVTVTGGSPNLTLNDGGIATFDAASSTDTNLVFDYTVQPNQNAADLTVTGSNLNGAMIADGAGNPLDRSGITVHPSGTLQIDTTKPTIINVVTQPGNGSFGAGQIVAFSLTPSEAVTVAGGTPTLVLNDGGIAIYDATHSTATNLIFNYIVQPGQNVADLAVTGSNLNGATITDAAGNAADLTGATVHPAGVLTIDTMPPTITGVSTAPGSGVLGAGQVVAITLGTTEAVTIVGGTPTLTLNDGGIAIYDPAASTATNLVFDYTVQSGQNTSDLAVTGFNQSGATITDSAGNAANLIGAISNPAGILAIQTAAPAITAVSTIPGGGSFGAGQVIAFSLTTSQAVTIAGGTPTLTLNDGGTATYDATASTATNLVFKYVIQSGDNVADLAVSSTNLNGATIIDPAGNVGNLNAAVGNPAGILRVDTTPPTITGLSITPGSGSLAAGQVVAINLTPSEAVTVAGGTLTLTLNDGGIATYDAAGSTATNLVFKYVVQPGDMATDLAVTGTNLNGATITDAAGNLANLLGAIGNPPGVLQIDTTRPPVVSVFNVTTTPGTGDLAAGSSVAIWINLTGSATVTGGAPTLTLSDGGSATYDATNSTSTSLAFVHTVLAGQNTPDLTVTTVALNGATIADSSGNAVDLSGAASNPGGILQIDTTSPTITAVTTAPGTGPVAAGQIVAITLTASEAVTVTGGTPTLTLDDGGIAIYDAVNSTATKLVFDYTVQVGQNSPDLAVTGSTLNGATIADQAGNALDLSGSVGNPAGTLKIDTTAPTVIAVTTQPGGGTVTVGEVVTFTVTPSEALTVNGGTPTLTLNDGGVALYDAAASTPTALVFDYTVAAQQNTSDLTVTGSSLNGASVTDAAGNALDLSGAVGNPPGVLVVDTMPVVTSVVATSTNSTVTVGDTITLSVATSAPTTITGGIPTLTLSDGGIAVYDASTSTPTMLTFTNTVKQGENTSQLSIVGVTLNGATITDGVGRTVSLDGAVGDPNVALQVDTTAPTVLSMVLGVDVLPEQIFTITAQVSEPIAFSGGVPSFLLNNGGVAYYDPARSTPTSFVFTYSVQPGDDVGHLTVDSLQSNGSIVRDMAGNTVDSNSVATAISKVKGLYADVNSVGLSPHTLSVYRFFDATTGTHFYTQDPKEQASILATRPDLVPEGPNGVGLTAIDPASNDPRAVPVYRFFDLTNGTHFFTASATERDAVIATRQDLTYEPSSTFYEHVTPQTGDTAVYRFFDTQFGTHFYTDDPKERALILQTRPDLVQEGIGFYEPARNPVA